MGDHGSYSDSVTWSRELPLTTYIHCLAVVLQAAVVSRRASNQMATLDAISSKATALPV
jgi:hypothetical protein